MQDKAQQDDDLVINLVELALAQPEEERETYLRGACGASQELFEQAWNYVQWEHRMGRFLLDPLYSPPAEEQGFEPGFEPGQLLENRFRILREVAQGGMGIVYEALDEKLDRRIAIKCAKSGFRKRLPPEVRHASEISHPNVCKIYEIHTAHTSSGEIDFVTMEFLDGETLADRIRRKPVPEAEAQSIGRQLCAGISAAHSQGVIHGDLKSSNVILTKSPEGATRAVITDFGMARARESSQATAQSGPLGGTPEYMAPELWKGERATFASDVYALGVLLRELSPVEASAFPKSILAKCLAQDPRDRYPSGTEVAQALEPTYTRRWLLLAAAAVLVAVATGVVTYLRATAPQEVVRLAMLPFTYGPELAPVAEGIFQETSANLAKLKGGTRARYSAVSLNEVQRSRAGSPERAKGLLGATHVLHGTLTKEKDQILLHALLTDTRTGVNVRDLKMDYEPGQERYLPVALAGFVTGTLHLPPLAYHAINAAAQTDYDAGTALLRHDATVDEAIAAFERAVAADPDSALVYAGLADAQYLKYAITREPTWLNRATETELQAQRRNPDLSRVLFVAGSLDVGKSWYDQAIVEFQRALELDANYSDAIRRLGRVYELNGQSDRALMSYRRAVEADPQYYRSYVDLGQFYIQRDEYSEALQPLRNAVALATKEPYPRYALALAYMNLGQFSDAESELRVALDLQPSIEVLNTLGMTMMYERQEQKAIPLFTRALQMDPGRYLSWMHLGNCYRRLSSAQMAQRAYSSGLAKAKEAERRNPKRGYTRAIAAYLQARLRNRQEAESEIADALTFSSDGSEVRWIAVVTYEALEERPNTLAVLGTASPQLLEDLNRWPDLAGLQRDPAFIKMLPNKRAQ